MESPRTLGCKVNPARARTGGERKERTGSPKRNLKKSLLESNAIPSQVTNHKFQVASLKTEICIVLLTAFQFLFLAPLTERTRLCSNSPSLLTPSDKSQTSAREPLAKARKWTNSFLCCLSLPSAIFAKIETGALLIWDVRPYNSKEGKFGISPYFAI